MTDIIVLLGAATFVAILFHFWKLPPIVAFFTAGALVGPHGLALIQSPPQVGLMTEAAGILLMFTIGLEFSLQTFTQFRRPLILLGAGQVLGTILVFFGIFSVFFQMPPEKAIFFSFITSLSSTAVVLKLLTEHRDLESPHGKAGVSILLSQDIAVIPMIVTIPFLYSMDDMATSILQSIFPITLLILGALFVLYLLNRFALPYVLSRVAQTRSREVFFFSIVFFVASMAFLMHELGLSMSLGAFIAGMLIAGSAYGKQATAEVVPLRDAFLGLFFVTIGMLLDPKFVFMNLHWILLIGIPVLAIRMLVIFLVVWFSGNPGNVARVTSLLLFQLGEFSFILAEQGLKLNLLTSAELQYFISIALMGLAVTPFVYKWLPVLQDSPRYNKYVPTRVAKSFQKARSRYLDKIGGNVDLSSSTPEGTQPAVLLIGYGVAGRSVAKALRQMEIPYKIIEANSETVSRFKTEEPIIYGDASTTELLERAGLHECRLVVILTSGISTLEPVLRNIRKQREDVPVIARTNYLQDLHRVQDIPFCRFVISELETTVGLVEATLTDLEVDSDRYSEFVTELKLRFRHEQDG